MLKIQKKLKKRKKQNWSLIFISVSVVLLFLFLILMEMNHTRMKVLQNSSQENETYLEILMNSSSEIAESKGENLSDVLMRQMHETFSVSASSYMVAAKNDEIFWLMDEEITNNYAGSSLERYLKSDKNQKQKLEEAENSFQVTLEDKENYIVSLAEMTDRDDNKITIAIIENSDYLLKHIFFDTLQIHILFYFILLSISFLSVVVYLVYRERDKVQEIEQLKIDSSTDRLQIEELEDRMFSNSQERHMGDSIFFPVELVEEVVDKLTVEQRKNSVRLIIKAGDIGEKALMQLAVMIERMKLKKCLCCFLGNNTFLILLLNRNENTAESFVQQLFAQYELNFGTAIFHVEYFIEPLEKEKHHAI